MYVGDSFRDYSGGVWQPSEDDCPDLEKSGTNHAMLVVGYGEEEYSALIWPQATLSIFKLSNLSLNFQLKGQRLNKCTVWRRNPSLLDCEKLLELFLGRCRLYQSHPRPKRMWYWRKRCLYRHGRGRYARIKYLLNNFRCLSGLDEMFFQAVLGPFLNINFCDVNENVSWA